MTCIKHRRALEGNAGKRVLVSSFGRRLELRGRDGYAEVFPLFADHSTAIFILFYG